MPYNPNVAQQSEDQATNIGLRHIQTLQEAASIGSNVIFSIMEHRPTEVSLTINMEDETVVIKYEDEKDWEDTVMKLSHYQDLLSSFIVS
jgi:hypothetical protein